MFWILWLDRSVAKRKQVETGNVGTSWETTPAFASGTHTVTRGTVAWTSLITNNVYGTEAINDEQFMKAYTHDQVFAERVIDMIIGLPMNSD